jgi:exopolysaccharide biosynthesis polyprenyl glycosylphosphotransferase
VAPDRCAAHRLALVAVDAIGINLAFAAAYVLRYDLQVGGPIAWYNHVPYSEYAPWSLALTAILLGVFWLEGLYGRRRIPSWIETIYSLITGTVVGVASLTILIFGLRPLAQSRLMLPYAAVLIVALLSLIRLAEMLYRRRQLRRGQGVTRTLIVGAGEVGRAVMRNIMAQPETGYSVIGFLDDDPGKQAQPIGRFEPLGGTADLLRVVRTRPVDEVIIALPWQSRDKIIALAEHLEGTTVRARIVPDLFQMSLNRVDFDSLNGIPLIAVRSPSIGGWSYRLKRAIDVTLAGVILVVTSPLMALIAVAIRLDSPGPALFLQPRVGRDGQLFMLYKFRSMVDGADDDRESLRDQNETTGPIFKMRRDPRLTSVGRALRRLSLDELPQFWNVLRGDISLVGPRPPMPCEVEHYDEWHRRRLEIAPGLTGLWQVSGRSDLTFDEMVMLDLFYAENWSLALDIRILLRTVPTVLLGTGAY